MTDTGDLKKTMAQVDRDLRDRPARRLVTTGSGMLAVSAPGVVAIIVASGNAALAYVLGILISTCATMGLLGGLFLAAGCVMREIRTGLDSLREEIRDARVAETMVLGQLASHLDPLRVTINSMTGFLQAHCEEIAALRERQEDLERDVASLILTRRTPDSSANGSRTVAGLRALRPDEMG